MVVADFMLPKNKVAICEPSDSVQKALDYLLTDNTVGCVVVVVFHEAVGIVTKTDLILAYQKGLTLEHPVHDIMSKGLEVCSLTATRDEAAAVLEKGKHNHALVLDDNKHFAGVISTWMIAAECAKDIDAAGDYLKKDIQPGQRRSQMGDSFRAYVDHLGFFD